MQRRLDLVRLGLGRFARGAIARTADGRLHRLSDPRRVPRVGAGMFVCGDHRDTASLQGAMFSGERTAAAVLRHLAGVD